MARSDDPYSRKSLFAALSAMGGRMVAGSATEGFRSLAPGAESFWGAYSQTHDDEEKKAIAEHERARKEANDAFRQQIEDRRADQADTRETAHEKDAAAREAAAAAREAARQAESDRRDKERSDRDAASQKRQDAAAERADRRLAIAEGRAAGADQRSQATQASQDERGLRSEARTAAQENARRALSEYRQQLKDRKPSDPLPGAPKTFDELFDDELEARGMKRLRPATPPRDTSGVRAVLNAAAAGTPPWQSGGDGPPPPPKPSPTPIPPAGATHAASAPPPRSASAPPTSRGPAPSPTPTPRPSADAAGKAPTSEELAKWRKRLNVEGARAAGYTWDEIRSAAGG
jgi:DNA gyrase/topoisomerase IV subunit B